MSVKIKATFEIFGKRAAHSVMLPAIREVCSRCSGTGKHVNPAVDGHGIDPQEFVDDPEFEEAYFGGRYDVTCEVCQGERCVNVPDLAAWPAKMRARWRQMERERREVEQIMESERRMGA